LRYLPDVHKNQPDRSDQIHLTKAIFPEEIMKLLKFKKHLTTCLQLSILFALLISPVTLFAFSDINDSTTQEETVKKMKRRMDSLELRFEKAELERNEAKKTALDWSRGLYLNVAFNFPEFNLGGMISFGYMFSKTNDNNRKILRIPLIRFGQVTIDSSDNKKTVRYCASLGYNGLHQITERVSFINGLYLNVVPDLKKNSPSLYALSGEYAPSLNFWYTEASALGIGFFARLSSLKEENKSWSDSFSLDYSAGLRLSYTQCFLKNISRKKSR
jgi:hypothetical protein